jgi:hypothetical protein
MSDEVCEDCGEVKTICPNCDGCRDCCDCVECENCGDIYDKDSYDFCKICARCDDCCECDDEEEDDEDFDQDDDEEYTHCLQIKSVNHTKVSDKKRDVTINLVFECGNRWNAVRLQRDLKTTVSDVDHSEAFNRGKVRISQTTALDGSELAIRVLVIAKEWLAIPGKRTVTFQFKDLEEIKQNVKVTVDP